MKTSELIKQAKELLWDGKDECEDCKEEFICYALLHASSNRFQMELSQRIRDDIEVRLHPWNNLYSWLRYEANISEKDLTYKRVQAHRLAWMNKLIKEYKAKGD